MVEAAQRDEATTTRSLAGAIIEPYRGYGSAREIFLLGRLFREPDFGRSLPENTLRRRLVDLLRRSLRRGIGHTIVEGRVRGFTIRAETDSTGYFRFHDKVPSPSSGPQWHELHLGLPAAGSGGPTAVGKIFVPTEAARFVVISDIDDTVMFTGVVNKAMMMWRLFMRGARSRVAFPGVASLYQALHAGRSGSEGNPMLYVSRAPWAIYEVLDAFFNLHRIPIGPVLFLRDWGLTIEHPLPRTSKDHKLALIRRMLDLYDGLPFVLIGDSGQRDPEVYASLVEEHPDRIRAIYIRNVSRSADRQAAIHALAEDVAEAGSTLLLAADSFAMAEHAVEHGLIPEEALARVMAEKSAEDDPRHGGPTRTVGGRSRRRTQDAVDQGAVEAALDTPTGGGEPANVEVESDRDRSP